MRRSFGGLALLLLAVFVLPLFAADEAKDPKKDDPKAVKKDDVKKEDPKAVKKDEPKKDEPKKDEPKKDTKKDDPKDAKKDPPKKEEKKDNGMVRVGQLTGTVLAIDESKKTLRLRVDAPKPDLAGVQSALQGQEQGKLEYLQASLKRPQDIQGMLNAQKKVNDNVAAQLRALAVTTPVDVEVTTLEDVVVRLAEPLPQFDDKGKLKRLTAKEKAELKGDPKLPGYKGEFTDMHTNHVVVVTLVRSKAAAKIKINPKMKDIDPALLAELKPQVSMIVVLGEKRH